MKVYIAGPMSGLPDFNYPAFFAAEEALESQGIKPLNPARNEPPGSATWLAFMRMSLVQISQSNGIALLPGWESSKGASIEKRLGDDLGLDVRPLSEWIETTP